MVKITLISGNNFFIKGELEEIANKLNSNKNKFIQFIEVDRRIGSDDIGFKYFHAESIISFTEVGPIKKSNIFE